MVGKEYLTTIMNTKSMKRIMLLQIFLSITNPKVFYLQEKFLSNTGNKEQSIQILSKDLVNERHTVINCNGDADTQIADSVLDIICENKVATGCC